MALVVPSDQQRRASPLLDLVYQRHSVRTYKAEAVDDWRLSLLLDAAVHAPTANHQEPLRFVIVQNADVLQRLSDRAKQMAKADAAAHGNILKRPGSAGDGDGSPFADPDYNIFYDAGTLVVICGTPTNEYMAADCWLAAENLMLAAAAEGLATCCVGFAVPMLNTPESKAELQIPATLSAFAPIIIGVPRGQVYPTARKDPVIVSRIR